MNRRHFLKVASLWVPVAPAIVHAQVMPSARRIASRVGAVAGAPPPSGDYFIEENLEGTGAPTDWAPANSGTTTCDWDYTTTVLQGSQSLFLSATGAGAYARAFTPTFALSYDTLYVYFLWRPTAGSEQTRLFNFRDSANSQEVYYITRMSSGAIQGTSGGTNFSTVFTTSVGTTYHVWARFNRADGSTSQLLGTVAISTDGVKPTSGDNFAAGYNTTAANNPIIRATWWAASSGAPTVSHVYDRLIIDTDPIGNNP